MIDLRPTEISGDNERKFAQQLTREKIPFRFGEIKNGNEKQAGVFLLKRFAVTFSPITPGIESTLRTNKLTPQIWHSSELRWQDLELRKRLPLHR